MMTRLRTTASDSTWSMILNIETTGLPGHDDLQVMPNVSVKDFLQMLQKDILKLSTLAHHRCPGTLPVAGLNRHTVDTMSSTSRRRAPRGSTLRARGREQSEVYLTGGPQTIGRGHGGTTTKRISHKQLSVIANTHTGSRSCGGYTPKLFRGGAGGGRWQALGTEDEGSS